MTVEELLTIGNRVAALESKVATLRVQPRLMDVATASTYIGRTEGALRKMIQRGELPAVRSDGRVFLDRPDLDRWIERSKIQ